MNKIRLLLIEDNRLLRDGIAAMLKGRQDIKMEKLTLHTRLEVANYAYTGGTFMKDITKSISMIHN
jgi:hypothetical protein